MDKLAAKTRHPEKRQLRSEIRLKRRSLSRAQQKSASINLFNKLIKSRLLLKHHYVALYLSNDGEICPRLIFSFLKKSGKRAYLPLIHPLKRDQIVFCLLNENTKLVKNRFGIQEPQFKYKDIIPAKRLSLVLLPLVAFDVSGNRLGMGGGFYDKAFSFKQNTLNSPPYLIGLAHEFQKQDHIESESWDIPLHGIMTENTFYR